MSYSPVSSASNVVNARLGRVHILVVDSSQTIRDLYRNIFQQLGFSRILLAGNAQEAVKIMKEIRIDLVIADIELPSLAQDTAPKDPAQKEKSALFNGIAFVRWMRRSPHSPNPFVPVIMLLGDPTRDNILAAREVGVHEILAKPFKAEELCDRITRVVDDNRIFVTAETYRGPCRRKVQNVAFPENQDRRKAEIRVIRYEAA